MPITLKKGILKYKNTNTGQYEGVDVVAETATSDQVEAIEDAASAEISAIEAKGAETRESIPDDYTELSDEVDELKSAIVIDENILSSETNITINKGIFDGLEPGFVNNDGAIYSTGTHSHITIPATGIKSISTVVGSQPINAALVVGKFSGTYKTVMSSSQTSVEISDVVDSVAEGDLLYLNFFGQVYNNPTHTGDYPENYVLTMYNRSERFGIKTESEIKELANEEVLEMLENDPVTILLSALDVYATGKFMNADGSLTNASAHEVVMLSSQNINNIKYTSATSASVAFIVEKIGDTVLGVGSANATTEFTYTPESDQSILYMNFFDYATAQDFVKQISVKYDDIIDIDKDEIVNTVSESLLFNLVRKPFDFTGKNAVFCGDSITRGYTSGSTITENGYPKLFSDAVGMTFENKGVGGATMGVVTGYSSILTQVQAVNTGTANFVFIAGGINDWQTGQTLSDFATAVNNICDYINTDYPNDLPVIWITPINQGGWEITHQINPTAELKEFRRVLTESVLKKDIYGRFSVVQGEWFNFPTKNGDFTFITAMFGDRLHPTELGYKVLYAPGLMTALC